MATRDDRCTKCSGKAYIPAYRRWDGGRCYRCEGTGREPAGGGARAPRRGYERLPHPSPSEAKAIADRELASAAKLLTLANDILATSGLEAMEQQPYDAIKQSAIQEQEEYRAAATFELAGLCIGRCVVDFQRFLRAIERGRRNVHGGPQMKEAFEEGLKAGIREQAARYEGIDWEDR